MFDPWALLECVNAIRDLDQSRADRAISRRQHRKRRKKLDELYEQELRMWIHTIESQHYSRMFGSLTNRKHASLVQEREEVLAAMEPEARRAVKTVLDSIDLRNS